MLAPAIASLIFTLAGTGTAGAVPDGTLAARANLQPNVSVAPLPDTAGRRAIDSARLFPRGYLPEETARVVAAGIAFTSLQAGAIEGDGVLSCRRLGARRVDCAMAAAGRRCEVTTAISFAAGRVRRCTYGCGFASHPRYRRHPRPVRRGDWSCSETGASCPPPLFGKLSAASILPSS